MISSFLLIPFFAASSIAQSYYNNSQAYASGALGPAPVQHFRSSYFTPPIFNFDVVPSKVPQPGLLFLPPRGQAVSEPAPMITNWQGKLVWMDPKVIGQTLSFSAQTLYGQPVLAAWSGAFNPNGYGNGFGLVLDQTYQVVANITTTIAKQTNDPHEFYITSNNTAIITVFSPQQYDLSAYNVTTTDGSKGWLLNCFVQEIDIATGKALFTWSALDHVNLSMTYLPVGATGVNASVPWDYFHMNSIDKDAQGNYLISSRHCHALYYVDGRSGRIIWTLNGKDSSFAMGEGSTFEWQHDARWLPSHHKQLSLFDDAANQLVSGSDEPTARGLLLNLDMANMSASLQVEFLPFKRVTSQRHGSMRVQPNGNFLVGFGQQPYFAEYAPNGTILWSVQYGFGDVETYRVLRSNWTGFPTTQPNISVITNSMTNTYDVYVSWNGATEVASWSLLGLSHNGHTTTLHRAPKAGFETLLSIPQHKGQGYRFLQVSGAMTNGSILGFSDFVSPDGATTSSSALPQQTSQVTVGHISFTTTTSAGAPTATATKH